MSCDLVTHDYLHIPGGMLDIGEEILAATGNVEVYTPTAEKFCGRSLSGLAIQEFAEKIKINDPLGAQDNNTIATPVTCEYNINDYIPSAYTGQFNDKGEREGEDFLFIK